MEHIHIIEWYTIYHSYSDLEFGNVSFEETVGEKQRREPTANLSHICIGRLEGGK